MERFFDVRYHRVSTLMQKKVIWKFLDRVNFLYSKNISCQRPVTVMMTSTFQARTAAIKIPVVKKNAHYIMVVV